MDGRWRAQGAAREATQQQLQAGGGSGLGQGSAGDGCGGRPALQRWRKLALHARPVLRAFPGSVSKNSAMPFAAAPLLGAAVLQRALRGRERGAPLPLPMKPSGARCRSSGLAPRERGRMWPIKRRAAVAMVSFQRLRLAALDQARHQESLTGLTNPTNRSNPTETNNRKKRNVGGHNTRNRRIHFSVDELNRGSLAGSRCARSGCPNI